MLVELSTFLDITKNGNGAGISMSNGGESVVNKVCALGCYSTSSASSGQFLGDSLSNDATKKNDIIDSSICSCKEANNDSYGTLYLRNANISINAVNFTDNICQMESLTIYPYVVSDEVTTYIKFTSIKDNYERSRICIILASDNTGYKIEETNFINNSQLTSQWALITTDGPTSFQHCTFLENDENPTHVWLLGNGVITLVDCTTEESFVDHLKGNVVYDFITPADDGKSFINAIIGTSNDYCDAAYDTVGILYPNPVDLLENEAKRNEKDKQTCTQDIQQKKGDIKLSKWRIVEYIFVVSVLNVGPSIGL